MEIKRLKLLCYESKDVKKYFSAAYEIYGSKPMLIKATEAATLLHTEEKAVIKWIRKEGLPATLVNGIYQINRIDLLEWATDRGIKVPPELFLAAEADVHYPTLGEALEAGGIHCHVPGDDKLSVLKNVVGLLKLPPQMDPDFFLQVLLARE